MNQSHGRRPSISALATATTRYFHSVWLISEGGGSRVRAAWVTRVLIWSSDWAPIH